MKQPADQCTTVVLVGHCGADGFLLKNAVSRALPGARIVSADDARSLERYLQQASLLLINRVLEYGFETGSGIYLIRSLASRPDSPRMMLISNYPEAQRAAVEAGAVPGFGKRDVYQAETAGRLRAACGAPGEHRSDAS